MQGFRPTNGTERSVNDVPKKDEAIQFPENFVNQTGWSLQPYWRRDLYGPTCYFESNGALYLPLHHGTANLGSTLDQEIEANMVEQAKLCGKVEYEASPTTDRRNSLSERAKDIVHEVAEATMELAHEVKEKLAGHVTDKDVAHAVKKVADLRAKLANEQHQLKKIFLAAEAAENNLNLTEYEELKANEMKIKEQEHKTKREIAQAENEYIHLQKAHLAQPQALM